ncbi:MAG: hypothetical protein WCH04_22130 [Gammaproteobacteria bacterium]
MRETTRIDDPAVMPKAVYGQSLENKLTHLQGKAASGPACLQPECRVLNAIYPWIPGERAFMLNLRCISSHVSR